jgi:hypothetical protein
VILLVYHNLGEDIGRGLVEFVEVVLLCRWFLLRVRRRLRIHSRYVPALSQGSA